MIRTRSVLGTSNAALTLKCAAVIGSFVMAAVVCAQPQGVFRATRSSIGFVSDAPMERIEATSISISGLLDVNERSFAMQVPVRSFEGFNSPLQREHFNENYMQSDVFPNAVFKGRIIEAADLGKFATYRVRAKGNLIIHGVARERIIECLVMVNGEGIQVTTTFDVLLAEHDIRVPRVVQQKISPRAQVAVDVLFTGGDLLRK